MTNLRFTNQLILFNHERVRVVAVQHIDAVMYV